MIIDASGTLAYAGLSAEGLLSRAKAVFAQAQPPVPGRFGAFLPLFPAELVINMAYNGPAKVRGARVAPSGFSVDPAEYFAKLYARMPELYAEHNALRNFSYEGHYVGRAELTVDEAWANAFPQYRPFMGDKLTPHLIGGGSQAVAVPESVYPRGGRMLLAVEERLQVTKQAREYVYYVRQRVNAGETYDAEAFASEYLSAAGLEPFAFSQADLERVLQDLSVVKSLQGDTAGIAQYTENARRAGRVNQYVPMRYACDRFIEAEVDKHTAWLMQPCWQEADYIGDLWIPYPDFFACVDKVTMTLDMRRLCQWYQIAPRYDPETGGGLYPDAVRIASVREHSFVILTGDALNNPAYGEGIGPEGGAATLVTVTDSREMIRQRKLVLERASIAVGNRAVPPEEYRRMLVLAVLQEHKGRLIDSMYRCETALRQIDPGAKVYEKACALLTGRVDKLNAVVSREADEAGEVRSSGYDADLVYLRGVRLARENGEAQEEPFARNTQREESIEGGYAMRAGLLRLSYAEAALPESPAGQTVGADDSEDGEQEPLPPLAGEPEPEAMPAEEAPPAGPEKATPKMEEPTAEEPRPEEPEPAVSEKPTAAQDKAASAEPAPKPDETEPQEKLADPEPAIATKPAANPAVAKETETKGPETEDAEAEETPLGKPLPAETETKSGKGGQTDSSSTTSMQELAQRLARKTGETGGAMHEFLQKHGG